MLHNERLGNIEIYTLPVPGDWSVGYGTYTFSGRVFVCYKLPSDPADEQWTRMATLNDDGTDICNLFEGEIKWMPQSGGIRYMPFRDNRRMLLGDWIMECEPDMDSCRSTRIIPLEYPEGMREKPGFFRRWSEIIIAPDNVHMAWTQLDMGFSGGGNFLGELVREKDKYTLRNVRSISDSSGIVPDENNPGCFKIGITRGGELKQFTRGGRAVSEAGSCNRTGTIDSVEQDLDGYGVRRLTTSPGYEETTLISEDGKLGIAMSTRFSPRTNFAAFGLLPRPLGILPTAPTVMSIYLYAVAGVRAFRKGNIGPILYEISHPDDCVDLHDPEERWVYYSPMSWKPDSTRAMWNEKLRRNDPEADKSRVQIAVLKDRKPTEMQPDAGVPENIPYAKDYPFDDGEAEMMLQMSGTLKFVGNGGGTAEVRRTPGEVFTAYTGFSDGKHRWTGTEHTQVGQGTLLYEADVEMTGTDSGSMHLRAYFTSDGGMESPTKLSFDTWSDGKPATHGYAVYNGTVIRMEDMLP